MVAASWGFAGAILQLGCAKLLGFGDFALETEGTEAAAPEAGSDDGSFLLQWNVGCLAPNGAYTKMPVPLPANQQYEILVRTTEGGFAGPFRAETATPADQILRFHGLPAGERYVRRMFTETPTRVLYYVVQGNRLQLGSDQLRREDSVLAPVGSTLQVRPTGLSDAGATSDEVQGSLFLSLGTPSGAPPTWNAPLFDSDLLFDGTRGDVAWVARMSLANWKSAAQICKFPDAYRMNDAGASSVSVACSSPASKQHLDVEMLLESFAIAAQRDIKDHRDTSLTIHAIPGGGDFGPFPSPTIAYGDISPGTADPVGVDFANPAPGTWSTVAEVRSTFRSSVATNADGGISPETTTVMVSEVISGTRVRVDPRASAPGVSVGGKDVVHGGFVTGVGLAPRIVLTPVAGELPPTRYQLQISPSERSTDRWSSIRVYSRNPEIVLPPDSLVAGKTYALEVEAHSLTHETPEEPHRGFLDGLVRFDTNYFTP